MAHTLADLDILDWVESHPEYDAKARRLYRLIHMMIPWRKLPLLAGLAGGLGTYATLSAMRFPNEALAIYATLATGALAFVTTLLLVTVSCYERGKQIRQLVACDTESELILADFRAIGLPLQITSYLD